MSHLFREASAQVETRASKNGKEAGDASEKETDKKFEAGSKDLKTLCTLMEKWESKNAVAELGKDEL